MPKSNTIQLFPLESTFPKAPGLAELLDRSRVTIQSDEASRWHHGEVSAQRKGNPGVLLEFFFFFGVNSSSGREKRIPGFFFLSLMWKDALVLLLGVGAGDAQKHQK